MNPDALILAGTPESVEALSARQSCIKERLYPTFRRTMETRVKAYSTFKLGKAKNIFERIRRMEFVADTIGKIGYVCVVEELWLIS